MSREESKKLAIELLTKHLLKEWEPSITQFAESILSAVAATQDSTIQQVLALLRAGPKDRQFTLDEVAIMIEESHKNATFDVANVLVSN